MHAGDAARVARLHAETITQGFLTRLGPRFLRQIYLGVAADPTSRVWVAVREGEVLGFLAYAVDVGAMYRRILRARTLRLAFASLPYTLNPWIVREVLDTLRYPHKQSDAQLPPAEILSVGVSPAARGGALGGSWSRLPLSRPDATGRPSSKYWRGPGWPRRTGSIRRVGSARSRSSCSTASRSMCTLWISSRQTRGPRVETSPAASFRRNQRADGSPHGLDARLGPSLRGRGVCGRIHARRLDSR